MLWFQRRSWPWEETGHMFYSARKSTEFNIASHCYAVWWKIHANCLLLSWECKNSNMSLKKKISGIFTGLILIEDPLKTSWRQPNAYRWKYLWKPNPPRHLKTERGTCWSLGLVVWVSQQFGSWHSSHIRIWNVKNISANQKPASDFHREPRMGGPVRYMNFENIA